LYLPEKDIFVTPTQYFITVTLTQKRFWCSFCRKPLIL